MVFMCIKHVDNKLLATFQSRFPATRRVRSHQLNDKRKLSSATPPPLPKKGTCTRFKSQPKSSALRYGRPSWMSVKTILGSGVCLFALLEIARIYKALKPFAHLQGPVCYKDPQNKGINLIVY